MIRFKTIFMVVCLFLVVNYVYPQYTQPRRRAPTAASKRSVAPKQNSRTNRSNRSTYNKPNTPRRPSVRARAKTTATRRNSTSQRRTPNYNMKKPMSKYKASTSNPTSQTTTQKRYTRSRIQPAKTVVSASTYKYTKSNTTRLRSSRNRLNRNTFQKRKDDRAVFSVVDFSKNNPVTSYSDYNMMDAVMFGNMMFGIYFHDYYDHVMPHSYLWHYHHQDYDISHWSDEDIQLYHHFMNYYKEQGTEPDARYVDPGTSADENYIQAFVDANSEDFYGKDVETVTVESLPDEELLAQEFRQHIKLNAPEEDVYKHTSPSVFMAIYIGLLVLVGIFLLGWLANSIR